MAEMVFDGDEQGTGDGGEGTNKHTRKDVELVEPRILAPPTLLPSVLHRLGLAEELSSIEEPAEIAVDDVVMNLKSDDWQTRLAAVRRLGRLGERVPVELLDAVLDDEDGSVRAATVHVLGCAGKRAPLPRLVSALHDSDWQVREAAVLVLGDRWQDVSSEELRSVLSDEDEMVRQAARFALHLENEKKTSGPYGRLWEQKNMQERQEQAFQKREGDPFETAYGGQGQAPGESGYHEYAQTFREQTQAYAPQEHFSYDHTAERIAPPSERWEKVTNLPARRAQSRWWWILGATAIVFFLLGSGVTRMTEPAGTVFPIPMSKEMPGPMGDSGLDSPKFATIIQNEVSSALNMSPDAIRGQLKAGGSLRDIAAEQGVSEDQLQKIELQALSDAEKAMFKPDSDQSQRMLEQLKGNQQVIDKLVTNAFLMQDAKAA